MMPGAGVFSQSQPARIAAAMYWQSSLGKVTVGFTYGLCIMKEMIYEKR